jgi:hypothetical protein
MEHWGSPELLLTGLSLSQDNLWGRVMASPKPKHDQDRDKNYGRKQRDSVGKRGRLQPKLSCIKRRILIAVAGTPI